MAAGGENIEMDGVPLHIKWENPYRFCMLPQ